jgi:hypothetical protein
VSTFEFNGPVATMIGSWLTRQGARWILAGSLLVVLGWLWAHKATATEAAFGWIAAVLLLSPIVHPWYLAWLIPFLALRRDLWVLVWSGTVIAAYAVLPEWWSASVWDLPTWALLLEYLPVYGLLIATAVPGVLRQAASVDRGMMD